MLPILLLSEQFFAIIQFRMSACIAAGHANTQSLADKRKHTNVQMYTQLLTMDKDHLGTVFEDQVSNPTVGQCYTD